MRTSLTNPVAVFCSALCAIALALTLSTASANVIETYDPSGMPGDFDPDDSTTGTAGSFFDLTAINNVNVTAFEAFANSGNSGGPFSFDIWYRPGTYEGSQGNSTGWTLLETISGTNPDDATPELLTLTTPFMINASQTFGFLISSTQGGFQWYDDGRAELTGDANLTLTVNQTNANGGVSPANGFGGTPFDPNDTDNLKAFAGRVHYDAAVAAVPDTGTTLALFSIALGGLLISSRLIGRRYCGA